MYDTEDKGLVWGLNVSECGSGKVDRGETTGPCRHQEEAFALISLFICLLMDLQTL